MFAWITLSVALYCCASYVAVAANVAEYLAYTIAGNGNCSQRVSSHGYRLNTCYSDYVNSEMVYTPYNATIIDGGVNVLSTEYIFSTSDCSGAPDSTVTNVYPFGMDECSAHTDDVNKYWYYEIVENDYPWEELGPGCVTAYYNNISCAGITNQFYWSDTFDCGFECYNFGAGMFRDSFKFQEPSSKKKSMTTYIIAGGVIVGVCICGGLAYSKKKRTPEPALTQHLVVYEVKPVAYIVS